MLATPKVAPINPAYFGRLQGKRIAYNCMVSDLLADSLLQGNYVTDCNVHLENEDQT